MIQSERLRPVAPICKELETYQCNEKHITEKYSLQPLLFKVDAAIQISANEEQ